MKKSKFLVLPLLFFVYFLTSVPFQSCEPDNDDSDCDTCIKLYKPNIYIYPKEQIDLSVKLSFPMGGKIIKSIPEYGTGWNVTVDTNGLIDNTYSYLFYESTQPDIWQRKYGWIIKIHELELFFSENMNDYGFNEKEINDFIDYWIPRFDDYEFYLIYPQTKTLIDDAVQLSFSEEPDNILRLFYVVKGQNQLNDKLLEPTIDNFNRDGYFVTEWGVILK